MTLLSFVLPFLIFISFPSRFWNFDGVACAAALELGNPMFFFHSNHLLYGFFGYLFWKPLTALTLLRALPALQLFTSLLSAGALMGLYKILVTLFKSRPLALLAAATIGVTAGVWMWSIEAQVYALGFLAISWATYLLIQPDHKQKWMRVGALHAAAVLGHVVHVLWLIPVLYWISREEASGRSRKVRHYLGALAVLTLIPYGLVISGLVLPEGGTAWLLRWLMGSAALVPNSLFQWHFAGWTGPLQWGMTTLRIFWGSFWPYHTTVPAWAAALTILSIAGIVFLIGLSIRQRRQRLWSFCALWLVAYGAFFWTWEPQTECYRLTDFVPLGILLALGTQQLRTARLRAAVWGMLFVSLFSVNLQTRIGPMHDPQNNLLFQEIQALAAATPADSIYLTQGGMTWIYLLYFPGRLAWNLNSLTRDPAHFKSELRRHVTSRPVFIQTAALTMESLKPVIAGYRLLPLPSLPWMQLR